MQDKRVSADGVYEAWQPFAGVWAIEEGGVRSFLIDGGEEALLIDTGFGRGDLKAFLSTLTRGEIRLVNTHADGDHLGCNHQFAQAFMHPAEFDRYLFEKERPCAPVPLWEGEHLRCGGFDLEVVLIPGHTPGSIALLDEKKRLLISGDSVQSGAVYLFGQGRNLPAYRASLDKLAALSYRFDWVLPSHGEALIPASALRDVREGAAALQAGQLQPQEPPRPMPCKLYTTGKASFLYEA